MKRLMAMAALAASAVLVLAQPAAASWEQETTPVPSGSQWQFSAVSCTTTSSCMAVGTVDSTLLAESRSTSGWSIVSIPDPSGAQLSGISCTGSVCEAVGQFDNGGTTQTLAEMWNGSSWSVQSTPNPGGATSSQLSGVFCKSASVCEAVGQSSNGSATQTLAEAWNGSSWTIQSTPNASGQTSSQLNGVTCPKTTVCEAVGNSNTGPNFATLAEVWNGSAWTIQSTPNGPGGKAVNELNGVSCFVMTQCTATGDGFAERWNGTSWALQTIASAHGNTPANLNRVWCTASAFCIAVGSFFDKEAIEQAVSEFWNGTKWRLLGTPINTVFDSSGLSDVSCTFATACIGVGFYHDPVDGNRTLAENWTLRWLQQAPAIPPPAIASSLGSVSCPTGGEFAVSFCAAVGGDEESGSVFNAIVETWNGNAWALGSVPNASNTSLNGVSCTGAKACTAVGEVLSGGSVVTLALRWNGTNWTAQSTPNPAGAASSFLTGVSCPTAKACTAIGFWKDGSGNQTPFAEQWNGTTWALHTVPSASGNSLSQLNGVSCTAANACEATGSDNTGTWADAWNGTNWTLQTTPTPAGGRNAFLSGVSCTTATACTAVGSYVNSTPKGVPLAERWNGTNWTAQTPAVPTGAASGLLGVSCNTQAPGCWATGFVTKGSTTLAVTEGWNGTTWSVHQIDQPANVTRESLGSVSCPSVTGCMSVGFYDTSGGAENPLGEELS